MQLNEDTKQFLNIKDLSLLFGLSKTAIYRLTATRGITFTKLGHNIRFNKNDVLEYLERNTIKEIR